MLLRAHAGYSTVCGSETSVVPYRAGRAAFPADVGSAPAVVGISPPHIGSLLASGLDRMLKPADEFMQLHDHGAPLRTYTDKVLESDNSLCL